MQASSRHLLSSFIPLLGERRRIAGVPEGSLSSAHF
jgi:hypothetical protein